MNGKLAAALSLLDLLIANAACISLSVIGDRGFTLAFVGLLLLVLLGYSVIRFAIELAISRIAGKDFPEHLVFGPFERKLMKFTWGSASPKSIYSLGRYSIAIIALPFLLLPIFLRLAALVTIGAFCWAGYTFWTSAFKRKGTA